MTLKDSDGKVMYDTKPDIKTASRWSVSDTVSDVESWLIHKDIVGTALVDRRGTCHSKIML